jgi:hypothetical protein
VYNGKRNAQRSAERKRKRKTRGEKTMEKTNGNAAAITREINEYLKKNSGKVTTISMIASAGEFNAARKAKNRKAKTFKQNMEAFHKARKIVVSMVGTKIIYIDDRGYDVKIK